ncbi:MAG: serine/threonine-protein kinase [candidate division KSB1 bacterium]|nr:serine/threonine-protein kinase [candidate division KSB1 bacterium]MDZ7303112.1 serine/threonine-protein kinase [candidate division KSB1 bacterium]MDZ7312651.1 serine/threonine-protein kinase [candidate division KSB1 bacterium]
MIGKTISHYRILEKLGEGGMGIVYKAEDTKLKRIVALKFLPTRTLGGVEEKNRFLREAQAAAALNHPNIATIYEIEEADGRMFIAMEYIEGRSLQEKIKAGPLKIEEAIKIAVQIAEGLQAAHEKGIVHRDIKSANIIITEKGQAKIMDFGLAKLSRGGTLLTKEGMTLGTAAYMSPEQARGEVVDHRTDIWSLGVVLYEMITGRLPFRGEYEQSMMYSILNEDPEPLTAIRTGVPLALDGILAKALAKDRALRYQHVDELPADLRAIESASVSRSRISSTKIHPSAVTKPNVRLPWIAAAMCFLLALAALTSLYFRQPRQMATIRSFIPLPEKSAFTTQFGFGRHIALSPDGLKLAITAMDSSGMARLWVRPLSAMSARELAGTEGASDPFWSPDNRFIAFFANNKLKKIEATGGTPFTICDAPEARGGAWSKADMILFAPTTNGPLYLVPAAGGAATALTKLDTARKEIAHRWPCFLPDGKHFLYFAPTSAAGAPGEANAIYVASLDLKVNKLLVRVTSNMAHASGYLLFHRSGTLVAQRFDVNNLELEGDAIPIAEQVQYGLTMSDLAAFSASQNGILAYLSSARQAGSRLLIVDRSGKPVRTVGEIGNYMGIRFSPDAQKIAVDIFDSQSRQNDIWVYELTRDIKTRLTFSSGSDRFPVWSPDGNRLVFHSSRKGIFDLYQKATSGVGSEELLFESKENKQPFDWSWDKRFIAFDTYGDPKTRSDVWVLPLFGDRQPFPFLQTEADELYPAFSPDGRWIAYVSDESRQNEVYVRPFPRPSQDGKWQISTAGGTRPRWRRDGKELFYLSNDNKIMAAEIHAKGSTIEVGAVRPLFQALLTTTALNYDVSPDGQHFLINSLVEAQSASSINLVVNWMAELKNKD